MIIFLSLADVKELLEHGRVFTLPLANFEAGSKLQLIPKDIPAAREFLNAANWNEYTDHVNAKHARIPCRGGNGGKHGTLRGKPLKSNPDPNWQDMT